MKCPFCGAEHDKVVESRTTNEGEVIRRRRECETCGERFTSYERVEPRASFVIKKDNRREPYDREKIKKGLLRAVEKRPVSLEKVEQVIQNIERKLPYNNENEVSSDQIGLLVMEELEKLDPVAYVRFASVYREFKSVNEFVEEIKTLRE
ncbi:transcriptional regulator NrdR family [Candidatus Termititenax persephonae]|uniref:Transcriptional repressor NrdR n=1 Tax=Candidatus Termititenax persephonae TaxID=2218525 RepID=A0A388TK59_9BACT|nr:transcriptional regulator NrdR family [Candidatus Termititenax persephonae]